jgi:ferredoxin
VHCGFCTATCPTYQLLGDELDGPRGRIYLIKQVLEGEQPTRKTQLHLDRCLTCRNCESTCPSGVQYGTWSTSAAASSTGKCRAGPAPKALRWLLKEGLTSPLFGPAMKLGQAVRGLLPGTLKAKVPARQEAGAWPTRHACAQGADAGGLRAAVDDAQHQQRHGARARRGRHPGGGAPAPAAAAPSSSTSTTRTAARRRCATTSTRGGRSWSAARSRRS